MKLIESTTDLLNHEFINHGFRYIAADFYRAHEHACSIHDLKKLFDTELSEDGKAFRRRAYLKLNYDRQNGAVSVPANQAYFQTSQSNQVDGGKIRQFKVMPLRILKIPILESIINRNIQLIRQYQPLRSEAYLTLGMHFIRYQAHENGASYSSPDWLHKDDEPLVFIHLVNLSKNALGGDNLIADSREQKVTHVVRLENDIDTLVLNKNVYHAVTPLGSRKGTAARDVILFTVEPNYTQQYEMESVCA